MLLRHLPRGMSPVHSLPLSPPLSHVRRIEKLTASIVQGAITMGTFSAAMNAKNPFLGYDGDFDEAAAACFRTAVVFAVLSFISFISFVVAAMRSKMDPQSSASQNYQNV